MQTLAVGTHIGPYEILSLLGKGGMGEVYRARDTRLARDVAIKVLPTASSSDPDRLHRFQQEARAIAALNHPHICQLYDVGPGYLVLEFVDGRPLQGPMPAESALRLALQLVGALAAAHQRGILHRDLKPANVLVSAGETAKLLDFGLAKLMDSDADVTRTMEGAVLGTAAYMSPEQAEGRPLDARSDVFSLGAVLYEMLSGARAFVGTSLAQVLSAVLRDEPLPLVAPPLLERIVMRCLAKRPEDRFQTMEELKTALEGALSKPVQQQASIAILPFASLSADKENEYFGDGLAEEIINILARLPGLTVIARTSAFAFKGKNEDVRKIAEALGVTNILEGSVRRAGNRVRVTAQLVAATDGRHLWSERYDREMTDIFAIQDEIAESIVAALQVKVLAAPRTGRRHIPSLPAFEAYLKGRYYWSMLTPDSLERSRECYEQAIALDSGFALPHCFLGELFFAVGSTGAQAAGDAMPRAREAVERALEIDPSLAEAHALLGSVAAIYDYDWTEGARRFQLAISRQPVTPHVRLHHGYFLMLTGRFSEAREEYERALTEDPLNALCRLHLAWSFLATGETQEAAAHLRAILAVGEFPWANFALGMVHARDGDDGKALTHAERAHGSMPTNTGAMGLLAGLLLRTGDVGRSESLLAQIHAADVHKVPMGRAVFHLVCREPEPAAEWLEKVIQQRDPLVVLIMRVTGPSMRGARWSTLVRMTSLPETPR